MNKKIPVPITIRPRHKFTKEQCSRGGTNARDIELAQGKKLNHGILWGKKDARRSN